MPGQLTQPPRYRYHFGVANPINLGDYAEPILGRSVPMILAALCGLQDIYAHQPPRDPPTVRRSSAGQFAGPRALELLVPTFENLAVRIS